MKNKFLITVVGTAICLSTIGCSAYKAMNQPDEKDLTKILAIGSDRDLVRAELGQPISYGKDNEGNETEVYSFVDGYSTANKSSRAVFHFAADVVTLGLWELVGNPVEGAYKGDKLTYRVTYKNGKVIKAENLTVPASNEAPSQAGTPLTEVQR
jgi:hypothetical protein